jgi:hypothetical protein
MPLLYRNLKNTCSDTVPKSYLQQLRDLFLNNAARNVFLTSRLLGILNLFKENDITALPFKGPLLAESVYGDLSSRQFADLDILVRKRDALKAKDLLISDAYNPEIKLSAEQAGAYLRSEDNFILTSDDGTIIIELHWDMSGTYAPVPLELEAFEGRLETASLDGKEVRNLCPEDQLLYLCIHGCKDNWEALDHVCCIAEVLRHYPSMDWECVMQLAAKLRCERMILLGFFLAYDLLDAPFPDSILERVKADSKIKKLAAKVSDNLFRENGESPENGITSRFSFFHIAVRAKLSDKIRYGLHLLFSPTAEDWRVFPFPVYLSFLHYVLRPGRLGVGLACSLWRRLRWDKK